MTGDGAAGEPGDPKGRAPRVPQPVEDREAQLPVPPGDGVRHDPPDPVELHPPPVDPEIAPWIDNSPDDDLTAEQELEREIGRCPHGVRQDFECEDCQYEAENYPGPGQPGLVRVTNDEIALGKPVGDYLLTHGEQSAVSFLDSPGSPDAQSEYQDRLAGLCALRPIELLDRMAVAARRNVPDYEATCRALLFTFLAARANLVNHLPGRTFTYYRSGEARWFGNHVAVIAPPRRGKGVELDFITGPFEAALGGTGHVVRAIRSSMPGLFGGTGKKGERVDGAFEQAEHGVVLLPELGNLKGLVGGADSGDAAGTLAEFFSSGRYVQKLLKGHFDYQSYACLFGAVQPDSWDAVADAVSGITTRFVFARLRNLSANEIIARLTEGSEGFAVDPLAVRVFGAKVRRITEELRPRSFDASAVEQRLIALVKETPVGMRVGLDDVQRWISVTFGYYLAAGGDITGDVTLPDPWDVPVLRGVLEEDGRARNSFRLDPGERLVQDIDVALNDPRFSGPRTIAEIVSFLVHTTGASPSKVRAVVSGYSWGGTKFEGLVERQILRSADRLEWDALTAEARDAAHKLPESDVEGRLKASAEVVRKVAHRPAARFVYIPPSERIWGDGAAHL